MTRSTTQEAAPPACAAPFSPPEAFAQVLRQGQEIDAARGALDEALGAYGVLAAPDHFKVHDLEGYQGLRRRMRGTFATRFVEPFARYVAAYAQPLEACVFVDAKDMSAKAVLNLGSHEAPGHADNLARLEMDATAPYKALLAHTSGGKRQGPIAEFFEDWSQHVAMQFFGPEGDEITLRQAVAAVRRVTIETASKVEAEVQQLSASLSAFESVKASSRDTLPVLVYLTCRPYADLQERLFVMRLSVTRDDKGPIVTLRVQNPERHMEEMGQELITIVQGAIGAGAAQVPVLLGSYARAS